MSVLEEICRPSTCAPHCDAPQVTLQETLILYGRRYVLDVDRKALDIRILPVSTWIYQMEGIEIEKRLIASPGASMTSIEYELFAVDHDPLPECHLEVRVDHARIRHFDLSRCTRATVVIPSDLDSPSTRRPLSGSRNQSD